MNSCSSPSCTPSIPTQPKSNTSPIPSPRTNRHHPPTSSPSSPPTMPPHHLASTARLLKPSERLSHRLYPLCRLCSRLTPATPETTSVTASTHLTAERHLSPSLPSMTPLLCQQPPISLHHPYNPICRSIHGRLVTVIPLAGRMPLPSLPSICPPATAALEPPTTAIISRGHQSQATHTGPGRPLIPLRPRQQLRDNTPRLTP
jgi:hypothetical protein